MGSKTGDIAGDIAGDIGVDIAGNVIGDISRKRGAGPGAVTDPLQRAQDRDAGE
jgi:hypothetical protein